MSFSLAAAPAITQECERMSPEPWPVSVPLNISIRSILDQRSHQTFTIPPQLPPSIFAAIERDPIRWPFMHLTH